MIEQEQQKNQEETTDNIASKDKDFSKDYKSQNISFKIYSDFVSQGSLFIQIILFWYLIHIHSNESILIKKIEANLTFLKYLPIDINVLLWTINIIGFALTLLFIKNHSRKIFFLHFFPFISVVFFIVSAFYFHIIVLRKIKNVLINPLSYVIIGGLAVTSLELLRNKLDSRSSLINIINMLVNINNLAVIQTRLQNRVDSYFKSWMSLANQLYFIQIFIFLNDIVESLRLFFFSLLFCITYYLPQLLHQQTVSNPFPTKPNTTSPTPQPTPKNNNTVPDHKPKNNTNPTPIPPKNDNSTHPNEKNKTDQKNNTYSLPINITRIETQKKKDIKQKNYTLTIKSNITIQFPSVKKEDNKNDKNKTVNKDHHLPNKISKNNTQDLFKDMLQKFFQMENYFLNIQTKKNIQDESKSQHKNDSDHKKNMVNQQIRSKKKDFLNDKQ
ncbi:hypothetical protein ABPG74_011114 [Tetrahymena malaccensis]